MSKQKVSYPLATCHVSGGVLDPLNKDHKPLSTFKVHNFASTVDIIIPDKKREETLDEFTFTTYAIKCCLSDLLNEVILKHSRTKDQFLRAVMHTDQSYHAIFVSIIDNVLCLTLNKTLSVQTGIQMTKSQFKNNEIYQFRLELSTSGLQKDDSFLKLLRFFSTIDTIFEFSFYITDQSGRLVLLPDAELNGLHEKMEYAICNRITPEVTVLDNILAPSLDIDREFSSEESVELLDYIAYLSIGGEQLTTAVDPYLSAYLESLSYLDLTEKTFCKYTYRSALVPTFPIFLAYISLEGTDQFSICSVHGIDNVNYSFGFSEHFVHENGENNICFLRQKDNFICWETIGGRDNY